MFYTRNKYTITDPNPAAADVNIFYQADQICTYTRYHYQHHIHEDHDDGSMAATYTRVITALTLLTPKAQQGPHLHKDHYCMGPTYIRGITFTAQTRFYNRVILIRTRTFTM